MEKVMLSLHVLTAIVTVGPVTVAAWLFVWMGRPTPVVGDIQTSVPPRGGTMNGGVTLMFLHRVNTIGAVVALSVPVFGFATAVQLGLLTDAWLLIAIALTAAAAAVFVWGVVGGQRRALAAQSAPWLQRSTVVFTLLWMVVVTLMIFRPGSTTGVAG
ncbi:hypothetical protein HDC37_002903 [Microbacterium sp. AK009]|uniref:hypothetical protein n=1 Tax=Microbacterium sp. AK009 TaxID=2723068 RepID=UPI0015C7050B|nr:hypothetical protein [Microbacterium sp. AK009]NYF18047.1 hypothetical protein [Microbacterium sp. AK009]